METFQFSIEAQFRNVELVRKRVKAVLSQRFGGEASSGINDFCQVVSELLNNCVEHGVCRTITGELAVCDRDVSFTLVTKGIRFDPTAIVATMPEFDRNNELPEGGYGLAIIRELSDTFTYRYHDGNNITTVSKLIAKES